jgi:maltose/moltooligosaccharide transporter
MTTFHPLNQEHQMASAAGHDYAHAAQSSKPNLSFWQIICMNFGFFGIQYSFGLQQANMSPIYKYLGADEGSIPWLWLAGPMTGLLVQPIIGAMSDRTLSKHGRRTPYFLLGAIFCSLGLLAMPFSPALWIAASVLWILDAANNVTMEPYRAYVSDRLNAPQRSLGFLTQSAFTGLGQTIAYLSPSIFIALGMSKDAVNSSNIPHITIAAFLVGAVFSIGSILISLKSVPELPLSNTERAHIASLPRGMGPVFAEIGDAFMAMPRVMKQLALMKLFQWYALFCYWQYITLSLAKTLFGDTLDGSLREANLVNGHIGAFYNAIAFISAFALIPFAKRFGAKNVHVVCLSCCGVAMIFIPEIHSQALLLIPMLGIGLAWASIMGNPYTMLAGSIPPERTGVYMGIFNMFIVIPMMIQIFTLPLYYKSLLGGNPENVIRLAGALMLCAAIATAAIKFDRVQTR